VWGIGGAADEADRRTAGENRKEDEEWRKLFSFDTAARDREWRQQQQHRIMWLSSLSKMSTPPIMQERQMNPTVIHPADEF
jgi:hypothetical protein